MKILVAPNTMKGSLNANDFAVTVEKAFRTVSPLFQVRAVPIADGGDLTGSILCKAMNARIITVPVSDPLGRTIEAEMGISGEIAIIEMASASGLRLLAPGEPDPWKTTSFGTGQLIKRATELGCEKIYLGLGGSATVDGGIGIMEALGFTFLDENALPVPGLPESLGKIKVVIPPPALKKVEITLLCDVNNPLLGENGAAHVFAPQKGADDQMVKKLEEGMAAWVKVLEHQTGRNLANTEGSGAAGGVSVPLMAFMNTRLIPGADFIFELLGMDKHLEWADCVITGEGRLDRQSLARKAPVALAMKAHKAGKPVIALAGSYETETNLPFDAIFAIANGPLSPEESKAKASDLVYSASVQIARFFLFSNPHLLKNHDSFNEINKNISENKWEVADARLSELEEDISAHWYLKGLIYMKKQLWGNALNAFQKALEIDPGNLQARLNIEIIRSILNYSNAMHQDP
jgi:glycerate 2-kinase